MFSWSECELEVFLWPLGPKNRPFLNIQIPNSIDLNSQVLQPDPSALRLSHFWILGGLDPIDDEIFHDPPADGANRGVSHDYWRFHRADEIEIKN